MDNFEIVDDRVKPKPSWDKRNLVVYEPTGFLRRLTVEILRFIGADTITPTACPVEAHQIVADTSDSILIAGWSPDAETDALRMVRRMRAIESPARRAEAVLLTERRPVIDIEDARNAGADGLLLRPFSAGSIRTRLDQITTHRPRFIATSRFAGPDRRRRCPPQPNGPIGFKRGLDVGNGLVDSVQAALNQADDMAFQSMRRGDPIGARVGRSLRQFLESMDSLTPQAREIIDLHRSTLARLDDLRGADAQIRAELVNGLEAIVYRRHAA